MSAAPVADIRLPAALRRYFAAMDDGAMDDAAACFTRDCLYAPPRAVRARGGLDETEERAQVRGRENLRRRFVERGPMPHRHHVVQSLTDGEHCVLLGVARSTVDGSPWATFLNCATLAPDALIARYVGFFCIPALTADPVLTADAPEGCANSATTAAVVSAFNATLASGLWAEATRWLTPDAYVSLPARPRTVRDSWTPPSHATRPLPALARHVRTLHTHAGQFLLEGTFVDPGTGRAGTYLASGTVTTSELLSRYVEFRSVAVVPDA